MNFSIFAEIFVEIYFVFLMFVIRVFSIEVCTLITYHAVCYKYSKIFAWIKILHLNIFKKQYHEKRVWNLTLNRFNCASTFEKSKCSIINLIQECTSIWNYMYTTKLIYIGNKILIDLIFFIFILVSHIITKLWIALQIYINYIGNII